LHSPSRSVSPFPNSSSLRFWIVQPNLTNGSGNGRLIDFNNSGRKEPDCTDSMICGCPECGMLIFHTVAVSTPEPTPYLDFSFATLGSFTTDWILSNSLLVSVLWKLLYCLISLPANDSYSTVWSDHTRTTRCGNLDSSYMSKYSELTSRITLGCLLESDA